MAAQPGAQAGWMPAEGRLKMPAGPTVNLLATAGSGHVAVGAYSPASSPFARGSTTSSRSSPAFISRTDSGVSEDVGAGAPDLTAATLQALGRQASLAAAAAAAAGSPTSGTSGSPHGASTPHPVPGRSNLGPAVAGVQQAAQLEASMQGGHCCCLPGGASACRSAAQSLPLRRTAACGAAGAARGRPPLLQVTATSHLLSDGLPSTGLSIKTGARAQGLPAAAAGMPAPVEVFARFPQVRLLGKGQ